MQYIQFILESNSNKKLDAFAKEIIYIIKSTGAVKAGPIAFKGKRLVYCYSFTPKTIDRLLSLKEVKGVNTTVNALDKS